MAGNYTFDALKQAVASGEIDTVLTCIVDMQGRLMGKRFHAQHFIESAFEETHCCNYLLATDLEMYTVEGYASTSWVGGYGDYTMKPDLSTLRPTPWLEGTVMVLCDLVDHHSHKPVAHSPRAMLQAQIKRLADMGYTVMAATELEFFLFEKSFEDLRKCGYRPLEPLSGYNEDYSILQTSREEHVMRPIRNHLFKAGIPIENSKGEAETGQEELNIRYSDALACADYHTIAKNAVKEIAHAQGHAASFMAKWRADKVGSATHIHQSLWDADGQNVFLDPNAQYGMSDVMKSYVAGLIKYAPESTYFLAPYINSYKRFQKGTFAPTKTAWSVDNRTAGFRLCGESTKGLRIECRIGGADLNPYLALAVQLAAGARGIEEKLALGPATEGDVYDAEDVREVPNSLLDAKALMEGSTFLRETFGDAVVTHYARAAGWEIEEFERAVTDYEIARGFERA